MTVGELIKKLEKMPEGWEVEVQIHSEGTPAAHVFKSGFKEVIISD